MKRSELKKLIKPIVKECIQESLLEGGILSKVISEVVMGLNSNNKLVSEKKENFVRQEKIVEKNKNGMLEKLKEQKQHMLDAIGEDTFNGINLFEGTEPLNSAGQPGSAPTPASPLADVDPKDSGVDISSLEGVFGNTWRTISNG